MSAVADSADIPTGTKAFAGFEWQLAGRYLRTRRREGFVSVIAGFSFLGIMLGVATLIIVMSVMNGFRIELLSKIVGVNGHIFATPIDRPLDDYDSVAARLAKIPGIKLAIPLVEGQALASSQTGNNGVLVQEGNGHTGTINQHGNNNSCGLFQFGENTNASCDQYGNGQSSITTVFGF